MPFYKIRDYDITKVIGLITFKIWKFYINLEDSMFIFDLSTV